MPPQPALTGLLYLQYTAIVHSSTVTVPVFSQHISYTMHMDTMIFTESLAHVYQALSLSLNVRGACRNSIVQYLVNISSTVQQEMHCLNSSPLACICKWGHSFLYQTHTSRIIIHHIHRVYYSHVMNSISDCAPNSHAV